MFFIQDRTDINCYSKYDYTNKGKQIFYDTPPADIGKKR